MHNISCEYLLQIEPKNPRTKFPVDDELTKKWKDCLSKQEKEHSGGVGIHVVVENKAGHVICWLLII